MTENLTALAFLRPRWCCLARLFAPWAGMNTVVQALRLLGTGFLPHRSFRIRHCLRAIAVRCCVDPERPRTILDLLAVRLMESRPRLVSSGPILGETFKSGPCRKAFHQVRCHIRSDRGSHL